MPSPIGDMRILFELLQEHSTLDEIRRFLAERELPRTATAWKEMIETRLVPALEKGKITREDLIAQLRDNEEHVRQHVFLYETRSEADAKQFISEARIVRILRASGLEGISGHPKLVGKPANPTIVDARFEGAEESDRYFVLKIVEKRIYQRTSSQRQEGNRIIREIEEVPVRAVNVFRLNLKGELELRIESYTNETEYTEAVRDMWEYAKNFFPRDRFDDVSLQRAKKKLGQRHSELSDEVRFSSFAMRDDQGTTYRIGGGSENRDIFDNKNAERNLSTLWNPETHCDRENVWFRKRDGQNVPSREIHVILGGASINEFTLTASCSKQDYEYVLGRIRHHNR